MSKYRKLPVVIEAVQWTGDNEKECYKFAGTYFERYKEQPAGIWVQANRAWLDIEQGSWIAKDSLGFYPIADSVFKKTYELVEE